MKPLEFSPDARNDIKNVFRAGVERFGREAADYFLEGLLSTLDMIETFPEAGEAVEEYGSAVRRIVHSPYVLLYVDEGETLRLVRVLDARSELWQRIISGEMPGDMP